MTERRTRKRKWDLDDQGQTTNPETGTVEPVEPVTSVEKVVENEPALAAASEIAAKIKANLEAKGATLERSDEKVEESPSAPIALLEVEVVSPKNEPSLLESFGIKTDEEKTAKKPKLSELTVLRKLDINDTRHRYYLSKDSTQQEVEKEFDVSIMTKGKYCPDRRLATEKDPALYLEIHGKNDEDVEKAVERLVEMIEKGPVLNHAAPQSHQAPLTYFSEKLFIEIEPSEAVPSFTIRGKILGPQGSFLKHIQTQTGCKVHLRGKGSGHVELGQTEEVMDGLHLCISSMRREEVEQAKVLANDLIEHVKKEVEAANAAKAQPAYPVSAYGYPPQQQQAQYQHGQYQGYPPQQPYYGSPYYNTAPQMQAGAYPNPYGSPPHGAYPQYPQYPQYPGYFPPPTAPHPSDNLDQAHEAQKTDEKHQQQE